MQMGHPAYFTKVSRLVTGCTPELLTPTHSTLLYLLPLTSFPEQTPNDCYVSITVLSMGEGEGKKEEVVKGDKEEEVKEQLLRTKGTWRHSHMTLLETSFYYNVRKTGVSQSFVHSLNKYL